MEAPPTSSCSDKSENDKIGTSLSAKTLKLNLDSQSSENDNSVDGNVIDMNVDLEISEMILILMITVIHQTSMNKDMSYYALIGLSILKEVTDLTGKCSAESCSGKVKIQNNFSKKNRTVYLATLSFMYGM